MNKVIFLDVDGTLVDYENRIPKSAIDAVRRARQNGHRVYICTGRSRAEIPPKLWDIGLDGMIGGNGSFVEDHGTVILHQLIFAEEARPALREYCRRKGQPDAGLTTASVLFPGMIYGGELYRDDLNKISYALNSYQDFLDTREQFPDMENGTWGGAGEMALFGDLGVKGITKGKTISCLLDHLGIKPKDTVAFGDARIDIPMLECCGIGVAMGYGGDEIKRAADLITDSVENDGLYRTFVKLGLIP